MHPYDEQDLSFAKSIRFRVLDTSCTLFLDAIFCVADGRMFQFLAVMQTMRSAVSSIFCMISCYFVCCDSYRVMFSHFLSIATSGSAIFTAYSLVFSLLRAYVCTGNRRVYLGGNLGAFIVLQSGRILTKF